MQMIVHRFIIIEWKICTGHSFKIVHNIGRETKRLFYKLTNQIAHYLCLIDVLCDNKTKSFFFFLLFLSD